MLIVVVQECGFFEKNGLKVELINYSGLIDQLFELIVIGKVDVVVGMIYCWFKLFEVGFDVKIIGSLYGGCVCLFGVKVVGVMMLQVLKGKMVGVSDLVVFGKYFFLILFVKNGIDLECDIMW